MKKYKITIHWKDNLLLSQKLLAIYHFSISLLFKTDGGWAGNTELVEVDLVESMRSKKKGEE